MTQGPSVMALGFWKALGSLGRFEGCLRCPEPTFLLGPTTHVDLYIEHHERPGSG